MIKELLKKRCFVHYRINEKYWDIIVNGTGIFFFDKKHCNQRFLVLVLILSNDLVITKEVM